ncbi:MAG: DMT family transporter [Phycisphaerales bacterium]|nr:DMT family transporter [Phycisphaerales bacterium]
MKPYLFAIAAGLCWAVGELFTKSVLQTHKVGPVTAIAFRSTIAIPVLWLAYYIAVHRWRLSTEPSDWMTAGWPTLGKLALGGGLVAGAAGMLFFYAALSLGEISRMKPIAFATAPAVAVLLGWLILKEPMTARKAVGAAVILVGVFLLTGD